MKSINASTARAYLYKLIDQAAESSDPIAINGKRNSAVLVGMDDWKAIEETMFLLSIPGMRESIVEGMAVPQSETSDELDW